MMDLGTRKLKEVWSERGTQRNGVGAEALPGPPQCPREPRNAGPSIVRRENGRCNRAAVSRNLGPVPVPGIGWNGFGLSDVPGGGPLVSRFVCFTLVPR